MDKQDIKVTKLCLNENNIALQCVELLGTAHISVQSVEEVKTLIDSGHYDAVAVELCQSRYKAMIHPEELHKLDIIEVIKTGKLPMMLVNLTLGAYQQRMAENVEVALGAEMKTAIEEAEKNQLPIILIDRDVKISLQRLLQKGSWWQNLQLMTGLFISLFHKEAVSKEEIEKLKQGDVLTQSLSEISEKQEMLYDTLIKERDEYMTAKLLSNLKENEHKNILAVVGAGHVFGMQTQWEKQQQESPEEIIQQLEIVKKKKSIWRFIPWIIVALIIIGFAIGFSKNSELGIKLILDWVWINGSLSALGAAIALGHPITIISAFIAAPITSLNPTIGAGMVTALVQAMVSKPKVADLANIRQDTQHLTGWWRNKVARILLVFVLSSLGSAAGTYIGGANIAFHIMK